MSAINTFVSLCTSISYCHLSEIIKLLIFLYFNLIAWPIPYSKAVLRSLVIHCIAINKKNKQNLSLILYLYLICSSSPILFRQPIKHVKEQPVCNIYQTYNRPNTLMGEFLKHDWYYYYWYESHIKIVSLLLCSCFFIFISRSYLI